MFNSGRISTKNKSFEYKIINPNYLNRNEQKSLLKDIDDLIIKNWGGFGQEFIKEHIFHASFMILLFDNEALIGFSSISEKILAKKKIYYFEFTVIDRKYSKLGLAEKINLILIKRLFLINFLKFKFNLEFLVITPNMRVLGLLSKYAKFIYPNPYLYDGRRIPEADDETWEMAKELIKISDNPARIVQREGLILEGSYTDTPWLIYKKGTAPLYKDEIVNRFGNAYLEYEKEAGKELIVRVKFTLGGLLKSLTR